MQSNFELDWGGEGVWLFQELRSGSCCRALVHLIWGFVCSCSKQHYGKAKTKFVLLVGEEFNCAPEKIKETMFVELGTCWKKFHSRVYCQDISRIMYSNPKWLAWWSRSRT